MNSMGEAALEERVESKEDSGRERDEIDGANYKTDLKPSAREEAEYSAGEIQAEYKSINQKPSSKKTKAESKKPANAESLEEKLGNNDYVVTVNDKGELVLRYQGQRVYGEEAEMPDVFLKQRKNSEEESSKGAGAIIYNKETGEFYLELKPSSYPLPEARGKLALVGGHVEETDFSSLDALAREFKEEFADRKAGEIVERRLRENGRYLGDIVYYVDKTKITIAVWAADVPLAEWNIVSKSSLTEGNKQVLKYDEILSKPNNDFAFLYETKLKPFILEEIVGGYSKSNAPLTKLESNSYKPSYNLCLK